MTSEWDLDPHELGLLRELVRIADSLDDLDAIVRTEGVVVEGSHGQKAHPALVERRQQAIAYARLAAVLRLPSGEEGSSEAAGSRRQRRVGVRGTYGIRGAVS